MCCWLSAVAVVVVALVIVVVVVVMVLGCSRSTPNGDCMRGKAEQLVTTTGDCLSLFCQSPASWPRTSDITSEMRVDVGSLLSPWLFTRTRLSSASLGTAPSPSASPCRPCLGSLPSPCAAAVPRQSAFSVRCRHASAAAFSSSSCAGSSLGPSQCRARRP